MECSICFDYIKNSCFGSCYHHFCFKCLSRWCIQNNSCPICKTHINQILYDKEFDLVNQQLIYYKKQAPNVDVTDVSNSSSKIEVDNINTNNYLDISNILNLTICFDVNIDKKLILTLKNNRGPGVYVCKINNNCIAYHYGLRKNDVLLFVNNIPCINHKQTINIFDNCYLSSTDIHCKFIRR